MDRRLPRPLRPLLHLPITPPPLLRHRHRLLSNSNLRTITVILTPHRMVQTLLPIRSRKHQIRRAQRAQARAGRASLHSVMRNDIIVPPVLVCLTICAASAILLFFRVTLFQKEVRLQEFHAPILLPSPRDLLDWS